MKSKEKMYIETLINMFKFLYDGASMSRWNDENHSEVGFSLIDKHSHKFSLAIWIAWHEELQSKVIDWNRLFYGSLYEYLYKCWFTDLKPVAASILYSYLDESIKSAQQKLAEHGFSENFCKNFKEYFLTDSYEKQILNAASKLATHWEYVQVSVCNPTTKDLIERETDIENQICKLPLAVSTRKDPYFTEYTEFIGQLRKQKRWTRLDVLVKTSDLGHEYMVSMMTLIFCNHLGICDNGTYGSVLTAAMHDHPEVYTGDVPSMVKNYIKAFKRSLKVIEQQYIKEELLPLFPQEKRAEIFLYPFSCSEDSILCKGKRLALKNNEDILLYNQDSFEPILGRLVKACDNLSGFMEAFLSLDSGIHPRELMTAFKRYYSSNKDFTLYGIYFGGIYRKLWKEIYSPKKLMKFIADMLFI